MGDNFSCWSKDYLILPESLSLVFDVITATDKKSSATSQGRRIFLQIPL